MPGDPGKRGDLNRRGSLFSEGAVEIFEENVKIGEAALFGMFPNTGDKLMEVAARYLVQMPDFVEPLDKNARDGQREQSDVVRLVFGLHSVLLLPAQRHAALDFR